MSRRRWGVLATVLAAVVTSGMWGAGVFGRLVEGGYGDPGSESAKAAAAIEQGLGARGGDVVLVYGLPAGTVDDPGVGERVNDRLGALPPREVLSVTSYWQSHAPQLVSADRTKAVATLVLAGADDAAKVDAYREIRDDLTVEGMELQVTGAVPFQDVTTELSAGELTKAEFVSLPIVLGLLLLIFGSLVAASLPVLVGGCAVVGALGVLHAIALATEVNPFAVNVASMLGLGMAIDYGLFMVGRFREEQAAGRAVADAVSRTVATAGRTVAFSATLLTTALAGLLFFPQAFLRSLAYGGMAAVALAALTSLTLLPALLAVLGPRVDRLPVRLRRRPVTGPPPESAAWTRLAGVVMRRPAAVALPIIAVLALLAAPVAAVRFGEEDERVLPAAHPARQAAETLKAEFPALGAGTIDVVLRGADGTAPPPAAGQDFAAAVARVPGIATVQVAGAGGDVLVLAAAPADTDPYSPAAAGTVEAVRALTPPAGTSLLVGGATAHNLDSLDATVDRLPWMIGTMVGATVVLMFLAFGSVLLPVKAVVLSALSLTATFGVLVWIFQEGHGADLLGVTPAPAAVGIVVLMAAVVFGLSTDYEVFLLSRMVEARARGAATTEAVTAGLVRTGRVITAAALLLIVVTGAFALSSLTTMRYIGVGMIIALVLDATVVRMLLVPAVLRLLGDWAWWAPAGLRRLQQRAGLSEIEAAEPGPAPVAGSGGPGRAGAADVGPAPATATAVAPTSGAALLDGGDVGPDPAFDPRAEGAGRARRDGGPADGGHAADRPGQPPGDRRSTPRHPADHPR